jgi:hypothetical protein
MNKLPHNNYEQSDDDETSQQATHKKVGGKILQTAMGPLDFSKPEVDYPVTIDDSVKWLKFTKPQGETHEQELPSDTADVAEDYIDSGIDDIEAFLKNSAETSSPEAENVAATAETEPQLPPVEVNLWGNGPTEEHIKHLLAEQGEVWREKTTPVDVIIAQGGETVPATEADQHISDGTAPDRIVKAGQVIIRGKNGVSLMSQQEFDDRVAGGAYEAALDEEGAVIDGRYLPVRTMTVVKNPFDTAIKTVNPTGFETGTFDKDAYLTGATGNLRVLTQEYLNQYYTPPAPAHDTDDQQL